MLLKKNLAAKHILIKELGIWHILPLHRMYNSLSDDSKRLFQPGFLGLNWKYVNITWLFAQVALSLSCFKFLRRLIIHLYPRAVFLSLIVQPESFAAEVVGFAFIKVKKRLPGGFQGALGIGIADEWQGKGIGSRLMAKLLQLAASEHVYKVTLQTLVDNAFALHLYERFGFQIVNTFKNASCWDGQYHDAYQMELELVAAGSHQKGKRN